MKTKGILKKYLIQKNTTTRVQFFLYIFSGGSAFVVYFFLLVFFTEIFKISHLHSLVIAYLISILVNFYISKYYVFKKQGSHNKQLAKFTIVALLGLTIQFIIVYIGTEQLSLHYFISNIIASSLVFMASFSLNKLITFK